MTILRDTTIRPIDLLVPGSSGLEKLEATNVTFLGPAVLLLVGNITFAGNTTFQGNVEGLIWDLDPTRTQIAGAIMLKDPHFDNCTFDHRIGIAGPGNVISQLISKIEV
ncbi:hypothetical protein J2Y69_002763 [Microbacterium resistens]|uniref:Uncharacterized protein n=1 Tax=Microbacterium resistens TaxID=156977 RepID=A0ABU1SEX2_9MICO|nr:hypothetical protein [Microbacterium resistens]MDR6868152.1 hypothetical protein [Microbacterium resistens]